MSKTKPIIVIAVAIALAASAAVYLSRQSSDEPASAPAPLAVNLGESRFLGNPDAPVTLVEFGDYQCPSCKHYHPMTKELLRRHPDKVKFEFRHFPLVEIHRNAMGAALAAEAAGEQGKFWEMHDLLFQWQEKWSASSNPESEFLAYAAQLGLDSNRFMQVMRSPEVQQRILSDITRGRQASVMGTPTFFVNGQRIEPLPANVDEFIRAMDDQLRAAR